MANKVIFDTEKTVDAHIREQMFKLRKKVFCDTLKWDIPYCNGLEADVYDFLQSFYMNVVDENSGNVIGSVRLIPLNRDNLLATVFNKSMPAKCRKNIYDRNDVWEGTRLCIDEDIVGPKNRHGAMIQLLVSLFQTCRQVGIKKLICNCDKSMLRLYRLFGLKLDRIGSTDEFGSDVVYCISFDISKFNYHALLTLAKRFKITWPAINGDGLCIAREFVFSHKTENSELDISYVPKAITNIITQDRIHSSAYTC